MALGLFLECTGETLGFWTPRSPGAHGFCKTCSLLSTGDRQTVLGSLSERDTVSWTGARWNGAITMEAPPEAQTMAGDRKRTGSLGPTQRPCLPGRCGAEKPEPLLVPYRSCSSWQPQSAPHLHGTPAHYPLGPGRPCVGAQTRWVEAGACRVG